jgi:hypothetical protein
MRNVGALGIALLLLSSPGLAMAQTSPALELVGRIPLENVAGRFDHMSADLAGHRLFAADDDNDTVEVIDVQAGKQMHQITGLDHPQQT